MKFSDSGGVLRCLLGHVMPLVVFRLIVVVQCAQGALMVDAGFAEQAGGGVVQDGWELWVACTLGSHRLELH